METAKKKRILICDDHLICCLGLQTAVESLDLPDVFEFVFAGSYEKSLELAMQGGFSLVFMDIKFPDGSGLAVIHRARAHLAHAQWVLITGNSSVAALEDIQEALRSLPLHGVIQKTHTLETLAELFRHLRRNESKPYLCRDTVALLQSMPSLDLTRREVEVLDLAIKGLTSAEIANRLGCSLETVKTHRSNMLQKTKMRNFAELSAWYSARLGHR